MKLSQILNSSSKQSSFLLGMIYAWPMISEDKKTILAYSAYKKNKYLQDIEPYYIKHKEKLETFLGVEYNVSLNTDINDKLYDTFGNKKNKLKGVSVILKNDINVLKIYGLIEKWLIDLDDGLKKWFIIGFLDGRGSIDFTGHFFSIDLAQKDNPEIIKRKLNRMYDIIGFKFNYNPRLLQENSNQKNDQFRINLEYFIGTYGFFRPSLINYYKKVTDIIMTIEDEFIFKDLQYINKKLSTITKNFEVNEFAISIKGLSKKEKLLKAKEYRLEKFDFDSEEEILYSSNNTKEESKKIANYKCELDNEHITFTSKSTNNPYVEAHHLIPFSKRNKFDVNIDILENLVSLCPNCHRKIHLSKDDEKIKLLESLYEKRKEQLNNELIEIDKEQLFSFYNIKDK